MVVSPPLPLEIVSTILRALDAQGEGEGARDALLNCSSVCTGWRGPRISGRISSDREFECDFDAPRLSAILRMLPNLHELSCAFARTTSLRRTLVPVAFTLATKPRMGTLHLKGTQRDPEAVLRVLAEVAGAVREVRLEEVGIESDEEDEDSWHEEGEDEGNDDGKEDGGKESKEEVVEDDDFVPVDTADGPICMFALEKLVVISCDDLPFDSESLHMPSLRTLSCTYEELPQLRDCMPAACALHTLVLSDIPEVQYGECFCTELDYATWRKEYVFDPFSVEHLCVRWCHRGYLSRGRTIAYALNDSVRLSGAKHLEVVVSLSLPGDLLRLVRRGGDHAGTDADDDDDDDDDRAGDGDGDGGYGGDDGGGYGVQAMLDDLEASILNGYRRQPFKRVTITVVFVADSGDGDKARYVDVDAAGAEDGGDGNGWKENEKDVWKDEEKDKAYVSKKFEERFVVLRRLVKLDIRVGMPPVMHL
ncbi:hypothetical protein CCMSSC00406_0001717 [Pleurotus cornucopiae]|uniref:Uncharacterized protein n=1 Tax=Pleurotus cornucopiae TaxID=5321 RepID=A0ACB7IM74_PLECO|nr:hypothetical protein CCMSSC00406_0001717 [Pleurotus cornucopiae]